MKILVRLRPNAKVEKIEKVSDLEFRVWVRAPAKEGKANEALIAALAAYFKRPKRVITLIRGAKSREKVLEIL